MLSLFHRPVLHPLPFEGHPVDVHLFHVRLGQCARIFGLEGRHLRDSFSRVLPRNAGEVRTRIAGTLRVQHHLPESLYAGVAFAVKRERRGCEVRENSQLIPLGQDHFSGFRRLRQDFPLRFVGFGNGRPPVRWIMRLSLGCEERHREPRAF